MRKLTLLGLLLLITSAVHADVDQIKACRKAAQNLGVFHTEIYDSCINSNAEVKKINSCKTAASNIGRTYHVFYTETFDSCLKSDADLEKIALCKEVATNLSVFHPRIFDSCINQN